MEDRDPHRTGGGTSEEGVGRRTSEDDGRGGRFWSENNRSGAGAAGYVICPQKGRAALARGTGSRARLVRHVREAEDGGAGVKARAECQLARGPEKEGLRGGVRAASGEPLPQAGCWGHMEEPDQLALAVGRLVEEAGNSSFCSPQKVLPVGAQGRVGVPWAGARGGFRQRSQHDKAGDARRGRGRGNSWAVWP